MSEAGYGNRVLGREDGKPGGNREGGENGELQTGWMDGGNRGLGLGGWVITASKITKQRTKSPSCGSNSKLSQLLSCYHWLPM